MGRVLEGLPRPDPGLHQTGSEGLDGNRGVNELRLLEHFGLRPSSDVLDVGCGIGRLAYACASFLDEGATYTGMDIAPVVIDWLNEHYVPRLPGFRFDLIDVHSERYRPDGEVGPELVRFPYGDGSFDVVCAFEVFMHLSLDGVRNYLEEMARVLRPGGLAVVTLVAIFPGEKLQHNNRDYVEIADGVHTRFPRRTTVSMAYDLELFRSLLGAAGLDEVGFIEGRIHTPVDERPGVEETRRVRRAREIGSWLAEAGPAAIEIINSRKDTLPAPEPDTPVTVEIPPLTHACDLFAAHKRS